MCILFFYINKGQTGPKNGSSKFYRLILASNRDEVLTRPTKSAKFWDTNENILAGQDMEGGGTWLGISKDGRISSLLNVMGQKIPRLSSTRGNLITNFLQSPRNETGFTYCKNLFQDPELAIKTKLNPFNFIAIDFNFIKPKSNEQENCASLDINATYLTNVNDDGPIELLNSSNSNEEYFSFGNTPHKTPLVKVTNGKNKFQDIISSHLKMNTEENDNVLIRDLLGFLKSTEKNCPDANLEKMSQYPANILENLSANYIQIPGGNFGTRTHTIILIDNENKVRFEEWTLKTPSINDWEHSKFEFTISPNNV